MKKITIQLSAIIIILFFFSGCDKYHRNRYTGTWEFETERILFKEINKYKDYEEIKRDTIYYTGKISLSYSDERLSIQYTESDEISVSIDKDGEMYDHWSTCWLGYDCATGKFDSKDEVHLCVRSGARGTAFPYEGYADYRIDVIKGTKKGRK